MIIDIHSHNTSAAYESTIKSFCMKDCDTESFRSAQYMSIGIHPWYINGNDLEKQMEWVEKNVLNDKRVIAIGECGTDKLCATSMDVQMKSFTYCIHISETYNLPLIIHSVKTSNEIINLKKSLKPKQPWIIHGFRGKPEQAIQYTNNGFFLSFGKNYNEKSLKSIPHDKLFFETDEYTGNINDIIKKASEILDTTTDKLIDIVSENAKCLFFNR